MNTILICIILFSYNTVNYIILFCILHTNLSFLFFFYNDIIYRRYGTRCIYTIPGLFINTYVLGILLIVILFFFNGFPLTLKFNLEFFLIQKLYYYNFIYLIYFIFIQIYFIIFFTKHVYTISFNNYCNKVVTDVTVLEFLLIIFNVIILVMLCICLRIFLIIFTKTLI